MIDKQRRNALKFTGGVGIGTAFAANPALAALANFYQPALPTAANRSHPDLEITIVNTTLVPDDTVILLNKTDSPIVLQQFMPGTIVFKNRILALDSLCAVQPLVLEPGRNVSRPVNVCELLATPSINEYVWADEAVSALSESTDIISLGAFFAGDKAIVYPLTDNSVPA